MSSEDVAKAVAKRLKYYLDTQRREDAFDLSGPNHPEQSRPVVRPGSSLAYDGLHDRSLKHYYREKGVKQQLQKLKTVDGLNGREKQVKKKIERTMQEYNYRPTPNKISPYAMSLIHPKDAMQSHEPYFKPRKSSKKKKHANVVVGKTAKVGRRAPDEKVSPYEKQRLVNMATKLIVATETIALPQNRRTGRENQTNSRDSLPIITGNERRASSASDPGPRTTPHPPKHKHPSRNMPHKKWYDVASEGTSLDSTMESVRSQMQHLKLDQKGDSFVVTHDRPTSSKNTTEDNSSQTKSRPKSAGDKLSPNHTDSDYDDFYDRSSSQVSPLTSPRGAWKAGTPPQSVDMSTQTVESRGTQTIEESHDQTRYSRQSSFDNYAASQTSDGVQTNEAVQQHEAAQKSVEPKILTYEIYVVTGDKLGAGTSSDVKINIFGKFGDSGDRPLIRSKSNKNPFERKQVDLFTIDSIFLGDLTSVRIGHNGTALGTGWFLDRVVIREDENSARAFEFKCGRWLSARDDDGQIVRDLPLSETLKGHEIPKLKETKKIYFKYRPDSASSQEGGKMQFRPLSASQKKNSDLQKDSVASDEIENKDDKKSQRKFFSSKSVDSSSDEENSKNVSKGDELNESEKDSRISKEQKMVGIDDETAEESVEMLEQGSIGKEDKADKTDDKAVEENEKKSRKKEKRKKEKKKTDDDKNEKENNKIENEKIGDDILEEEPVNKETERLYLEKTENADEKVEEEEGTATLEAEPKEEQIEDTKDVENQIKVDKDKSESENEDSSSGSSDDEGSSSASELFSISSDSSESDNSETDDEKSADEEEIEREAKDTSKKEDSDEEESRKKSAQDDYMAGFLAGVRANEQETHKQEEPKESILTKGPNIHQASESGDFERFKELVNEVPELKSKPDERGWTPLHIVTAFGHLEILKWLSVNGVNLTEETPTGFTSIHLAAMNGHVKCIMVLAAMGCPISCRTVDESTPLHLAAMSGHVECVKWLLANRANPNVRDTNGRTPLDLAVEYQHDECIELLELMATEMKRKDSVITKLRHTTTKDTDEPTGSSSKGTDSGIGGTESGEDGWISDVEGEIIGRGDRVPSAKSRSQSAALLRKKSKQEERAMEEMEEKRRLYEKQQQKMQRRESSFLDSIRQEIDSGEDDEF